MVLGFFFFFFFKFFDNKNKNKIYAEAAKVLWYSMTLKLKWLDSWPKPPRYYGISMTNKPKWLDSWYKAAKVLWHQMTNKSKWAWVNQHPPMHQLWMRLFWLLWDEPKPFNLNQTLRWVFFVFSLAHPLLRF